MEIKRGIERAMEIITAELQKMSKPVGGALMAQVGTISANTDETIGVNHRQGRQGRCHYG